MRDLRISIATIVIALLSLGTVMIYSSSGVYALETLGDVSYFLNRHLFFLCFGFVLMFASMAFDYRVLSKYAKPLMFIGILLLVLVLIPHIGKTSFGARRWFKVGPINFQPSELMKVVMIVYTADFLARKQKVIQSFWHGFVPIIIVLGCVCALILKQPDLGTPVLIATTVFLMLFMAGAKIKHVSFLFLAALPVLIFLIVKVSYRLARILSFLDPWKDSHGVGFQLTQSQIALGSGGITGVGLGKSMQKLFYLPAAHTDFIFSIIGEELGLIGTLSLIFLFIAFIWQAARIVKRTENAFGYFLGMGIVCILGLQTVINIGVSIGAFPTKGLPLPFISYGGSALMFNMVSVGLLLNISRVEDR